MRRQINEAQVKTFLQSEKITYTDMQSVTDEQLIGYIKEDISLHADYDKNTFEVYHFPDGRTFSAQFSYDANLADVRSQIIVCKDY